MKRKIVIAMWLAAVSLALILCVYAPPAAAKKGGNGGGGGGGGGGNNPPPAPPGTIYFIDGYFTDDEATLAMDGNGDAKTLVAEGSVSGTSSRLQYGAGYRWTLSVEPTTATYDRVINANGDVIVEDLVQHEVVARRPGPDGFEEIVLTDLFGYVNPTLHSHDEDASLRWANDQADTFFSFKGRDLSNAVTIESDGTTTVEQPKVRDAIFRVWVSGAEMHAFADIWMPVTWQSTDADGDPIVEVAASSPSLGEDNFKHDWSPDGSQLVYVLDPSNDIAELWVKTIPDGNLQLVFDAEPTIYDVGNPKWQPTGSKIAFWFAGDIYTVEPDGSDLQTVIHSSARAQWSPDGKYMAYHNIYSRFTNTFYQLDRIDVETGETIGLTTDLDKKLPKYLIDWFPPVDGP